MFCYMPNVDYNNWVFKYRMLLRRLPSPPSVRHSLTRSASYSKCQFLGFTMILNYRWTVAGLVLVNCVLVKILV
jgi:hypothetical protein